jgi:hypothetical protein
MFKYVQTTWSVGDRYWRLKIVAVEVCAMLCWKYLSQSFGPDSSSSRAT